MRRDVAALLALGVALCSLPNVLPVHAQSESTHLQLPYDKIPNFGMNPTRVSVKSGNWSDPTVWGGTVPSASDTVRITAGHTVTVDNQSAVAKDIGVEGTLSFSRSANSKLVVTTLLVYGPAKVAHPYATGTLDIGTEQSQIPANVTAELVFRDSPLETGTVSAPGRDPSQYGNGLVALGNVRMHGAPMNETFVRLASEPLKGQTTVQLSEPVSGWKAGDRLVLPDTRQLYYEIRWDHPSKSYVNQTEIVTLASVSADGKTLTLATPLAYDHKGARFTDGSRATKFDGTPLLPHVGNLTRNVVVRSEKPSEVAKSAYCTLGNKLTNPETCVTRGHVMLTYRTESDIRNVLFQGLGRTTDDVLDSTAYNASALPTKVGNNQIGRYALHAHHVLGSATSPLPNGSQFTIQGNAVEPDLNGINDMYKWGITLHGTSYARIADNVAYNWNGFGIGCEDGNEIENIFDHNFAVLTSGKGNPRETDLLGTSGAGFWFVGTLNHVRNNVAADTFYTGFDFWTKYRQLSLPLFPGADPTIAAQSKKIYVNQTPITSFTNNEAYGGQLRAGLFIWELTRSPSIPLFNDTPDAEESILEDFTVWHPFNLSFYNYKANHLTFKRLLAIGDPDALRASRSLTTNGLYASDYAQHRFRVEDSRIEGFYTGWLPSTAGTMQVLKNTTLRNYLNGNRIPLWIVGIPSSVTPPKRIAVQCNVRSERVDMPDLISSYSYPKADFVSRGTQIGSDGINLLQTDDLWVINHNGVAGDNFRVYYTQQAPDAILRQSEYSANGNLRILGSPEAGLTNAQAMAKYGIAFGGAIASCTTTHPGFPGAYVCREAIPADILAACDGTSAPPSSSSSSAPAAQFCLTLTPQSPRLKIASLLVTATVKSGTTTVATLTATANTTGKACFTNLPTTIKANTSYTLSVKPKYFLPVARSVTNLVNPSDIAVTGFVAGDFDGDGSLSLSDLIGFIRVIRGEVPADFQQLQVGSESLLPDLIAVIRLYQEGQ